MNIKGDTTQFTTKEDTGIEIPLWEPLFSGAKSSPAPFQQTYRAGLSEMSFSQLTRESRKVFSPLYWGRALPAGKKGLRIITGQVPKLSAAPRFTLCQGCLLVRLPLPLDAQLSDRDQYFNHRHTLSDQHCSWLIEGSQPISIKEMKEQNLMNQRNLFMLCLITTLNSVHMFGLVCGSQL